MSASMDLNNIQSIICQNISLINFLDFVALKLQRFFYSIWHSSKKQKVIFHALDSKSYWQSSRLQAVNDIGNLPDFRDICYLYNTKQQYIYNYLNNIILCTLNYKKPNYQRGDGNPINQFNTSIYVCLSQGRSFLLSFLCCSLILGERQLFALLILVEIRTFNTQYQYVSSYNR